MQHLTLWSARNLLWSKGYKFMAQHPMHEPCKTMEKVEPYGVSVVMLHALNCPHDIANNEDGSITIAVKPEVRRRWPEIIGE